MKISENFNAGADKVAVNSAAIKRRSLSARRLSNSADSALSVRLTQKDVKIRAVGHLNGGRVNTGIDALEWAKKPRSLVQARYCLQVWIVTVRKPDTILNLQDVFRKMQNTCYSIGRCRQDGTFSLTHLQEAILAASLFHFREIEINDLKISA